MFNALYNVEPTTNTITNSTFNDSILYHEMATHIAQAPCLMDSDRHAATALTALQAEELANMIE